MEPRIDEEPEIVRPGPENPSLLTRQRNHRSEDIWNGEVKYLVLTTALIFTLSLTFSKFFKVVYLVLTTAIIVINFAGPGPTYVPWSR